MLFLKYGDAALDGQNKLKFYWIDLLDSARRQLSIQLSLVDCIINLNKKMMDLATEFLKRPIQALSLSHFRRLTWKVHLL